MELKFVKKGDKDQQTKLAIEEAPRYTDVPILQSVIMALILGTLTLLLTYILKDTLPSFYSLIHERGNIQYLTIYCFWLAVGMLIFKWLKIRKQVSAFELPYVKEFTEGREDVGFRTIVSEHLKLKQNLDPEQSKLLLINRINKAVKQLMVSKNPAQVSQVLSTVSATDWAIIDASYIPIKFLIWLIPILGFLGTVMGMSRAISSFNYVLQGIKDVGFQGVQAGLAKVTSGLGVAFDTTFVALILAVIVNSFTNVLQKKEEDFLSDVEDFVTENIVNKLKVQEEVVPAQIRESQAQAKMIQVMEEVKRELRNMGKQNQINAEQLQQQIGRVIEALQAEAGIAETKPLIDPEYLSVLRDFASALRENKDSLAAMAQLAELLKANAQILENLKAPIEEMNSVNRRLGEIYEKIYKL